MNKRSEADTDSRERQSGFKLRDWLESVLFAAAIVAVLFMVFWPFAITGDSMEDSFHDRDRIAVSRVAAWTGKLARGDFVVCKLPRGGKSEYVMKRVIGIPGDSLTIEDDKVYINGGLLEEDYILGYTAGEISIVLGDDEYFVMGDNRSVSYDSRVAGTVKNGAMVGKVVMRWYPFNQITVY